MPRCRYDVQDANTKLPVTIVAVGQKLLHKWTCDPPVDSKRPADNLVHITPCEKRNLRAIDLWCMAVYNCFVEDGQNTEALIIDEYGFVP